MENFFKILLIGVGATLTMDLWAYVQKLFNISSLDYRLVGRWISKFSEGKFFHENIAKATPEKYEVLIGWTAHYLIGIIFAVLLVIIMGIKWLEAPTLLPALLIGIVTIIAPFFIMQPAFGFGFAASNLPDPNILRLRSLLTHSVYGIGLFMSAYVINYISTLIKGLL